MQNQLVKFENGNFVEMRPASTPLLSPVTRIPQLFLKGPGVPIKYMDFFTALKTRNYSFLSRYRNTILHFTTNQQQQILSIGFTAVYYEPSIGTCKLYASKTII